MTGVAKRGRGRPKGSKNKSRMLSGATVAQICEYHKHHPTEFLVKVAKGQSVDGFTPDKDDIYRANVKLHDSIHGNKSLNGGGVAGEVIDGQFTLLFEESSDAFTLPGEGNAAGVEEAMRSEPLQRAGDSSQGR